MPALVTEKKHGRWVEYRLAADATVHDVLGAVWSELASDPETSADGVLLRGAAEA